MTEGFDRSFTPAIDTSQASIEAVFLKRVVPLMAAHRSAWLRAGVQARLCISTEEFDRFCRYCLSGDADSVHALCDLWLVRGVSAESIVDAAITKAAQSFGQRWLDDHAHFAEVTQACWQLQKVLQQLTPALEKPITAHASKPRALMLGAEQCSHRLGLMVASSLLRREGFEVECGYFSTRAPFLSKAQALDDAGLQLLAFSLSCSDQLKACKALVKHIRRKRPDLRLVLGGSLISEASTARSIGVPVDAVIVGKPAWSEILEGLGISPTKLCPWQENACHLS